MRQQNMKDWVVAILVSFYGMYDPAVVTNPSHLQSLAKLAKNEMEGKKGSGQNHLNCKLIASSSCFTRKASL
jgi:hypothetical protein